MDMTKANHTRHNHARGQMIVTRRRPREYQNNKARLRKKRKKERWGDNQKHSTLNLNGTDYNGIKKIVGSNLFQGGKKRKKIEQERSTVADSGRTINFMEVSALLNNVQPTTNIANETSPNIQIITSIM